MAILYRMAGYSGTPLPKKLGIKNGASVWVTGGSVAYQFLATGQAPFGVVLAFCIEHAELERAWAGFPDQIETAGGLWIAWPKKASGVPTELSDTVVRDYGLGQGWVDNKVCAIDETWSALRFVRRVRDR